MSCHYAEKTIGKGKIRDGKINDTGKGWGWPGPGQKEMDRFKRCLEWINWTKILLDVGTEGEKEVVADL